MFHLAADVGGTFVDLVLVHPATRRIWVDKVSATQTAADGILAGIRRISAHAGIGPSEIERFVHGFTIATNAWLTREGARAVLVVTHGFRDLLEVASQRRPSLYALTTPPQQPLVPRSRVVEVRERISSEGEVVIALAPAEIARAVEEIASHAPEAVGISLLFSFLDDSHERQMAAAIAAAKPGLPIYLSSRINPQIQEYQRASTTAAAAYVGPPVASYVDALVEGLARTGVTAPLMLMRSDGGVATPRSAKQNPATMLLSGPAGGVIAAASLGSLIGLPNLITFDMGGTSADFSLISGGEVRTATERTMDGQVLRVPMLDIETISAGGGSIASIDRGGALRVGPASAGSLPGPACYGLGGTEPTLTDATVALGIIDPADFAGGDIRLDVAAARAAIGRVIAGPLGVSVEEAAWGMVAVACAQMRQAIRALSVERGHDLRDFALLAFGGAGSVFGAIMLPDLGVERLLIPPRPGVFAALGLLLADIRHARQAPFSGDLARITEREIGPQMERMAADLDALLARDGVPREKRAITCRLDLRYAGQFHDIGIPVAAPGRPGWWAPDRILQDFHAAHKRLFGHNDEASPVEVVGIRLQASGTLEKPSFPRVAAAAPGAAVLPAGHRRVVLDRGGTEADCPVYARAALAGGHRLEGPAIISQSDTTVFLLPGQVAMVDEYGNLHVRAGRAA